MDQAQIKAWIDALGIPALFVADDTRIIAANDLAISVYNLIEDPRNITPCMHLHFIAKNTERMGDLVTNIAEQVVYLVTGGAPEEARQKGDLSSTDSSISKV